MRNVGPVRRPGLRTWLALLLVIPALLLALGGCGSRDSEPKVLAGKGTPYSDLLVPKLNASVQDGAVGVPVDQPIMLTVQGACSARCR